MSRRAFTTGSVGAGPRRDLAPQGAPAWVVTYADMVSLLLCIFIAMTAMSQIKKDRFQQTAESLKRAFSGLDGVSTPLPATGESKNPLVQRIIELASSINDGSPGESNDTTLEDRELRVTSLSNGFQVVLSGKLTFDPFSAELRSEARDLLAKTAGRLRGYRTRISIRGHATHEPLPERAPFKDAMDLSYARAKAVADELTAGGVEPSRFLLTAVGDSEPYVRQTDSEERRALNRRVEIVVTEDLVGDAAGVPASELEEPPYGR